jgi:hypothetical protein
METTLIKEIIAGAVAIVAPVVTFIATRAYENRFLQPISSERARALIGTWAGDVLQDHGPDGAPLPGKANFKFSIVGKKIQGYRIYRASYGGEEFTSTFVSSGGFLHDRFIRFNYNSEVSGVVQFGSIILEMSNDTKSLEGRFLGFGVVTNGLVFGTLRMKKQIN